MALEILTGLPAAWLEGRLSQDFGGRICEYIAFKFVATSRSGGGNTKS